MDITAIFSFLAQSLGFINKRTDLKNQPDVKKAAILQSEQDKNASIIKAIEEKNVEQIRKNLS